MEVDENQADEVEQQDKETKLLNLDAQMLGFDGDDEDDVF